jgi:uncharacterized membrane protein YesL
MNKLDEILDQIVSGGMYLGLWICALLLAGIVFVVSTLIGAVVFGSFPSGLVVGFVVVFGGGYVLAKLGKRF